MYQPLYAIRTERTFSQMYLLWKTSEEDGLLGQSILRITGTALAVPFLYRVDLKTEVII